MIVVFAQISFSSIVSRINLFDGIQFAALEWDIGEWDCGNCCSLEYVTNSGNIHIFLILGYQMLIIPDYGQVKLQLFLILVDIYIYLMDNQIIILLN